jgi:hypothetical protein
MAPLGSCSPCYQSTLRPTQLREQPDRETRARIQKAKGEGDGRDVHQLLREVAWSVEEGAVARFETAHALAIACKKIREGAWSTPFRMPVDWSWKRALPETCSVAGGN